MASAIRAGLNPPSYRRPQSSWDILSLEDAVRSLEEGVLPLPSVRNLIDIMIKCMNAKTCNHHALRLHAYICHHGLESHESLGNYVVSMLVDAGHIPTAQTVFDRLTHKGERSWCSLINGYIKNGNLRQALKLHGEMQEYGLHPSAHSLVALIKSCAVLKDVDKGKAIHAYISSRASLRGNQFLGAALVDMYVKLGMLVQAQEVFDKLLVHDEASWNALISGYVQQDLGEEALKCLELMHLEGLSPTAITFSCCLKACGIVKDIKRGIELHKKVIDEGLLKTNQFVGNALVDMYAKCGLFAKAQEVFSGLPIKNIVSWNSLIKGYVQYEHNKEALNSYANMKSCGLSPDAITFACILKACSNMGFLEEGREIHAEIESKGFLQNYLVGNALLDFYVKLGLMEKSEQIFDGLSNRDIVSWGTLIGGYAQHRYGHEALGCLERMKSEGISPDSYTFISSLKACAVIGAVDKGMELHHEIIDKGLVKENQSIGTALVDMYGKFGLFNKAEELFTMLPVRNTVAWTALIAGYVQHEYWDATMRCFEQMEVEGVMPDGVTWICILQACGGIGDSLKGSEIHADLERNNLLKDNNMLGTALLDMYAKCGILERACQVLHELSLNDVASWNALISGYVQHEYNEEALDCFELMQFQGISPNIVTFACSLKACCNVRNITKGREIHAEISRRGLTNSTELIDNALVDLYTKCGSLAMAKEVFERLWFKSTITWNALISGCAQSGYEKEALNCFAEMQLCGNDPDDVTITCILKACADLGSIERGQQIHADIDSKGLIESNIVVGTALIDMYCKCGDPGKAQNVFNKIPVHNIVSWTALVAGYVQNGFGEEALQLFQEMLSDGITPNANMYACILKACVDSGSIERGREIHIEIEQKGFLQTNQVVGNALIDMYAKFGMLTKAKEVFHKIPVRDIISWNTLLTGYAQRGDVTDVLYHFEKMHQEGIRPDSVTFVAILNACSHAGLQDKGQLYYEAMSGEYGINPMVEHNTCVIDLFGRSGQLEKAVEMITKVSSHPDIESWLAVLAACRKWNNVELGKEAFERVVQLDENITSAYVCMYNIYADAGMMKDAMKIEAMTRSQTGTNLWDSNDIFSSLLV